MRDLRRATIVNLRRAALVASASCLCLAVTASPAAAQTFSTPVSPGGTASYDDGADRFCAQAYNSEGLRYVRVQLRPLTAGRGPSISFTDYNTYYSGGTSGATCRTDLTRAYEDTRYRATLTGYWGETNETKTKTYDFYS